MWSVQAAYKKTDSGEHFGRSSHVPPNTEPRAIYTWNHPKPKLQAHAHPRNICAHENGASKQQNIYTTKWLSRRRSLSKNSTKLCITSTSPSYHWSTSSNNKRTKITAYIHPLQVHFAIVLHATLLARSKPCHVTTKASLSPHKLQTTSTLTKQSHCDFMLFAVICVCVCLRAHVCVCASSFIPFELPTEAWSEFGVKKISCWKQTRSCLDLLRQFK